MKMLNKNAVCVKTNFVQNIFRVLLGAFMAFAGTSHLLWARGEFLAQVPSWLPINSDLVVLLSGGMEIILGLSMIFLWNYKTLVGLVLATFYVLIFPGNISQYINHVNGFGLDTDQARLVRLFFQPLLILWALWSTGALSVLKKGK